MPNEGAEPQLRVAFADIVNPIWTAGAHYYKNLFGARRNLRARMAAAGHPVLEDAA